SNPAPLLIRRAARFMRMGFMDILRELSPDSLAQVEVITGAHLQEQQT
ncbi:type VI secretion system protein TssA, partial [Delftia tsuruhatensis]